MKRILVCLMSAVLVVGLLPTAAFGTLSPQGLSATSALTDISNGHYAPYDTVRRLYTRPLVLEPNGDKATAASTFRTPPIDLQNPVYDDADIAVRYTGARPYLAFSDDKYKGWTSKTEPTWVGEDPGTGEKVALFSRAEIEAKWTQAGGGGGPNRSGGPLECQWMFVCLSSKTSSNPDLEDCRLLEVVALGGAERISPTSGSYQVKSGLTRAQIAQGMKAGYNMAGHFESNWVPSSPTLDGSWGKGDLSSEAHWARGTYVTRETLGNLKAQGFNAIRLPVTWFQHIYPADDPKLEKGAASDRSDLTPVERYHIDRAWLERVHEVVDWCIAEDMFVIVNIHHEDWIDRSDLGTAYDETDLPVKFEAVWTQIANEFSGYDQHLVFEDMNEPHAKNGDDWGFATAETTETVNRLNADFVNLVRNKLSGHQGRLLMMAHDTGNGSISAENFVMPNDAEDLLAHSLHCYSPHDWTHYFANGNHAGETGEANVYTAAYRREVEAKWENYRTRYIANGETIILGEFGCFYYGEERQQDRLDWMAQYATHAKELGIPMFYWRMDRTAEDANGDEYVIWSAFDEVNQKISSQSRAMIEKWFEVLGDDGVAWGSLASGIEGEHADIDSGVQLLGDGATWPKEIKGSHKKVDGVDAWRVVCSNRANAAVSGGKARLKWSDMAGKEIAVKFAGNVPRLGCMNDAWGGDSCGTEPDSVDYANGIAYFSAESIAMRWRSVVSKSSDSRLAGNTEQDITRILICTATTGGSAAADDAMATTVQQVAIVPVMWTQVKAPTCTEFGKKVIDGTGASKLIPSLGHSWASTATVDRAASYAAAGSKSIHCARCGASKPGSVVAIPKLVVPKVSLKSLKAAKKSFKATWKKAVGVSGYQLQYSLKSNFKSAKKVNIAKAKTTSKQVKKLKSKKKYYVRICSFVKSGGKTYCSTWSKAKIVKTK